MGVWGGGCGALCLREAWHDWVASLPVLPISWTASMIWTRMTHAVYFVRPGTIDSRRFDNGVRGFALSSLRSSIQNA